MLVLCSNGLSSPDLITYLSKKIKSGTAALVVTADNEYKENNYHISRCISELNQLNLTVDIIDLDKQSINDLLLYDVVEFIGGNPYYLLNSLRKNKAKEILLQIANSKILIGWSAGAIVMTSTIAIFNEFTPEMNQWGLSDFTGMNLTDIQIIPHYSKFLKRYEQFEKRCKNYEENNNCSLIRLNDGEGIAISNNELIFIK